MIQISPQRSVLLIALFFLVATCLMLLSCSPPDAGVHSATDGGSNKMLKTDTSWKKDTITVE